MKSSIQFLEIDITPFQAQQWLENLNKSIESGKFSQRTPSKAAVKRMALDMHHGNFILTHQAIAFDEDNNLIDGRQRLMAVVESRATVKMFVAKNVPKLHSNKVDLKTIDIIDSGRNRTLGQVFSGFHCLEHGHLLASILRTIGEICSTEKRISSLSKAQGFELKNLLSKELEKTILASSEGEYERRAAILAPVVLVGTFSSKAYNFIRDFCLLENISSDSPVIKLRRALKEVSQGSGKGRNQAMIMTFNALKAFINTDDTNVRIKNFESLNWALNKSPLTKSIKTILFPVL